MLEYGLLTHNSVTKLGMLAAEIEHLASVTEHMVVVPIPQHSGGSGVTENDILHWDVCGRKMPYTSNLKSAHDVMRRLVEEYGKRALQAEKQQGVDWKALSHAVRVGTEALELLATHEITFPLSNRWHVLAIKKGLLRYEEVSVEIEDLLVAVEKAAEISTLRSEPDLQLADDLVVRAYKQVVAPRVW